MVRQGNKTMSETKHTPGPWSLNEEGDPQAPSGELICMMTDGVNGEGEANARLIVAAPDLLAAFKAIVARHDGIFDAAELAAFGPLTTKAEDIVRIAQTAIAKAEGRVDG